MSDDVEKVYLLIIVLLTFDVLSLTWVALYG